MRAIIAVIGATLVAAAAAGTAAGKAEVERQTDVVPLAGTIAGGPECFEVTLTSGTLTVTVVEVLRDGGDSFVVHGTVRDAVGTSPDGTVYRQLGPFTVRGSQTASGSGTFTLVEHTRLISAGSALNAIATFRFHTSWDVDGPHVELDEFSLKCK